MNRFKSVFSRGLQVAPICAIAVFVLSGCSGGNEGDDLLELRGLVTYAENVSLPATARLEVELLDMTDTGSAPVILGRTVVENAGQVPIGFEVIFNAAQFDQGHIYGVNASILDGGQLLFTTPAPNGADLENLDGLLEVVVQRPY